MMMLFMLMILMVMIIGSNGNNVLVVRPFNTTKCTLEYRGRSFKCSIGKNGVVNPNLKVEGDGHTPSGKYPLRRVFYRTDRVEKPVTELNTTAIAINDGWCDECNDVNYNKHVTLPYAANHEDLYRDDNLYNIIIVIGYNTNTTNTTNFTNTTNTTTTTSF